MVPLRPETRLSPTTSSRCPHLLSDPAPNPLPFSELAFPFLLAFVWSPGASAAAYETPQISPAPPASTGLVHSHPPHQGQGQRCPSSPQSTAPASGSAPAAPPRSCGLFPVSSSFIPKRLESPFRRARRVLVTCTSMASRLYFLVSEFHILRASHFLDGHWLSAGRSKCVTVREVFLSPHVLLS